MIFAAHDPVRNKAAILKAAIIREVTARWEKDRARQRRLAELEAHGPPEGEDPKPAAGS
jgi:hypothetical protein